ATIDVKDIFFMVPLQEPDQERFAFTCEGQQCTFTHLPQGFKHSPTLAHHALAQKLSLIPPVSGVKVYQYIDDILIAGNEITPVQTTQTDIIKHPESLDLHIPPNKLQFPSQEVKFLGIWWKGGMVCISPDTFTCLEQLKTLENKNDLHHALGLLIFWRKHIPDFSIITQPLYDLLWKKAKWDWTPLHDEALQLLIFEANTYHSLGPIHSTDP
ncbi:TF29 protein, partial [Furnarius figulus]|nr:TF29 protein [Furnarius figulus]